MYGAKCMYVLDSMPAIGAAPHPKIGHGRRDEGMSTRCSEHVVALSWAGWVCPACLGMRACACLAVCIGVCIACFAGCWRMEEVVHCLLSRWVRQPGLACWWWPFVRSPTTAYELLNSHCTGTPIRRDGACTSSVACHPTSHAVEACCHSSPVSFEQ